MFIRLALPPDAEALYSIALKTGDGGRDATALHNFGDLVGAYYAVPYLFGAPELAFVAEDEQGIAGYTVGAVDTRSFEQWMSKHWLPQQRLEYPSLNDMRLTQTDQHYLRLIHDPEPVSPAILGDYPAHMHMNLLPRARGQGIGRALFDKVISSLPPGTPGIHIGARIDNHHGIAFWAAMGMSRLPDHAGGAWLGKHLP